MGLLITMMSSEDSSKTKEWRHHPTSW